VAETNGLVGRIGEQLLEKACTAAMAWERPMHLSVNLSASQLSDPLCALRLMSVLGRTGFPAPRLHIEITETTKLEQSIAAKENLYALRKAGARIMLDDFGAGYCSFERLASHQIDGVKIDKSLTSDMTTRESTHTIVLSIIYLARNLGLDVVAEGVETTEQSSALLRAGCNMAQGYHYGRPMPLANVPAFLGGDVFAATGSDDSVTALAG
jgi:EAL domain-containing protein (putative c-di-GMP-specific phosphodiesterase class I)